MCMDLMSFQISVRRIGILFLLTFFTFFYATTYVSAQGQAGVSISPALIEETLDPGTEKEYSVTIKNLNPVEQVFYVTKRDISDVRDGGAPIFADPTQEKTGMEISEWITLPVTEVRLAPEASEQINFRLKVPEDATPGSHFGSVFVSAEPPEFDSVGAAVGYQVANIVSIRVAGDANEGANIREFSTDRFFHGSKNVTFVTRIENTGNVLVRPTGPVEIYNMLGKKVDMFTFNESQASVFPLKVREYSFSWTGEGTGFGRYEAVLSPVYGDSGARKTMSSTVSFWILPYNIIVPALISLAVLLLIVYVAVRLYIKRTIAQLSYGQTRIVRKRKKSGLSTTVLLVLVMLCVTALFLLVLLVLFA